MGGSDSKPKEDDVQYNVTVYTGTRKHAGTKDVSVFIILHGDKGVSEELKLHHQSSDDFTKGHVDIHPVYCPDLGSVWKIEVWKTDKNNKGDPWYIERIVVDKKLIPEVKKKVLKQQMDLKRESQLVEEFKSQIDPHSPTVGRLVSSGNLFNRSSNSALEETKSSWTFPCYRWIDEREELWEGTSILPQYDTKRERVEQRRDELERKRGLYQWKHFEGLPCFVRSKFATLPKDEKWNEEKLQDFMGSRMRAGTNFGLDKLMEIFHTWKDFDDYTDLFTLLPIPKIQKVWKLDETFAKQRMQGINPTTIRRVTSLPIPNFPVTTELVRPLIRPGSTLESEMALNRLYYIDYSFFAEYDKPECIKEGRYLSSPMCLLYVNPEGKLMPIAIQLRTSVPAHPKKNPIFTPLDTEPEWTLCKMYFAQADGMHHQIEAHLMATHLITEPMVVSMHRNIASCHPMYKLLHPHFKYQLAINTRAREFMITPGGPVDEVMPLKVECIMDALQKSYGRWRFDQSSHAAMIRNRNITNKPSDLPGYYYRDDGALIWDAISSYVEEIVRSFYSNNDDVRFDQEIQNWLKEIVEVGFRGEEKGFPKKADSIPELVQILTTIIWTVSAQHAVLNFTQYENYAFIPSAPGSLYIAPFGHPNSTWARGKLTMRDIFVALPPKVLCSKQIAMSYVLSQYSSEDQMLGNYTESYFTEPKTAIALENYRKKLASVTKTITERGEWENFLPSKIPNATAV